MAYVGSVGLPPPPLEIRLFYQWKVKKMRQTDNELGQPFRVHSQPKQMKTVTLNYGNAVSRLEIPLHKR
jgi:hypothetical protein